MKDRGQTVYCLNHIIRTRGPIRRFSPTANQRGFKGCREGDEDIFKETKCLDTEGDKDKVC